MTRLLCMTRLPRKVPLTTRTCGPPYITVEMLSLSIPLAVLFLVRIMWVCERVVLRLCSTCFRVLWLKRMLVVVNLWMCLVFLWARTLMVPGLYRLRFVVTALVVRSPGLLLEKTVVVTLFRVRQAPDLISLVPAIKAMLRLALVMVSVEDSLVMFVFMMMTLAPSTAPSLLAPVLLVFSSLSCG